MPTTVTTTSSSSSALCNQGVQSPCEISVPVHNTSHAYNKSSLPAISSSAKVNPTCDTSIKQPTSLASTTLTLALPQKAISDPQPQMEQKHPHSIQVQSTVCSYQQTTSSTEISLMRDTESNLSSIKQSPHTCNPSKHAGSLPGEVSLKIKSNQIKQTQGSTCGSPQGSMHCAMNTTPLVSTLLLKSKKQPPKRHTDASGGIRNFFQPVDLNSAKISTTKPCKSQTMSDSANEKVRVTKDVALLPPDTVCLLDQDQKHNLNSTEVNPTLVRDAMATNSLQCTKRLEPLHTPTVIPSASSFLLRETKKRVASKGKGTLFSIFEKKQHGAEACDLEVSDSVEWLQWNVGDNIVDSHMLDEEDDQNLLMDYSEDFSIGHEEIESDICKTEQFVIQQPCVDSHTEKDLLPFPHLPRTWYMKEERLYNSARDARRLSNPIQRDSNNAILSMNRSQVDGNLESNLEVLQRKLTTSCSVSKSPLPSIM